MKHSIERKVYIRVYKLDQIKCYKLSFKKPRDNSSFCKLPQIPLTLFDSYIKI